MLETLEDITWDLSNKIQEELERNVYEIIENTYLEETALIQIKKNNEVFDIGIFSNVDKEEIEAIKKSEKEFEDLKIFIKSESNNDINELIQKYLIRRKLRIICWCVEPNPETGNYGISIGFNKGDKLFSILITEKDFLFEYFSQQIDSY